jgi:hypothetical protein
MEFGLSPEEHEAQLAALREYEAPTSGPENIFPEEDQMTPTRTAAMEELEVLQAGGTPRDAQQSHNPIRRLGHAAGQAATNVASALHLPNAAPHIDVHKNSHGGYHDRGYEKEEADEDGRHTGKDKHHGVARMLNPLGAIEQGTLAVSNVAHRASDHALPHRHHHGAYGQEVEWTIGRGHGSHSSPSGAQTPPLSRSGSAELRNRGAAKSSQEQIIRRYSFTTQGQHREVSLMRKGRSFIVHLDDVIAAEVSGVEFQQLALPFQISLLDGKVLEAVMRAEILSVNDVSVEPWYTVEHGDNLDRPPPEVVFGSMPPHGDDNEIHLMAIPEFTDPREPRCKSWWACCSGESEVVMKPRAASKSMQAFSRGHNDRPLDRGCSDSCSYWGMEIFG